MNDHNLDDLIIDNIEPKHNKAKSFLTIIALIIVVLIVAIVFTRTILKDPKDTQIGLEEDMTDMISPELTLQSAPEIKAPKEETKLSSMIEKKLTTSKKTEEIKKETVEITEKAVIPKKTTTITVPKPVAEKPIKEVSVEKPITEKTPAKVIETEKVIVPHKNHVRKETVKKVSPAVVTVPKNNHTATAGSYYIQVGSFSQTPSTRFLNTIKKHGFSYKITPPTANGTKKLLIGPYPSRADADNALIRVKDRINKGAFIVKK